jgi:hypothetical protein
MGPWPAELLAKSETPFGENFTRKHQRMTVDRIRDELYIAAPPFPMRRIDGRTGEVDKSWFPNGGMNKVTECSFGPDGNVYLGLGSIGYNEFIIRLDHDGKPVPFTGNGALPLPKGNKWEGGGGQYGDLEGKDIYGGGLCPSALKKGGEVKAIWTGGISHSNIHERGLHVSPKGDIVAGIQFPYGGERALKYGIPKEAVPVPKDPKKNPIPEARDSFVAAWDRDGNILTLNAVGDTMNGHGVAMDRDRNIYAVWGLRVPAECKNWVGLPGVPLNEDWGGFGCLVKFRGGVPFPRARVSSSAESSAGAVKLGPSSKSGSIAPVDNSILWAYPGVVGQTTGPCPCHNVRYDMDYYARHWLPADYLYSIVVIDANANIIARLGRYGNVDDTDEDVKAGRDGLRFVWPRAVAVSDAALYASDRNARRILKAAISYAAEETVALE